MATDRWGPMSDMLSLRDAMERLFQESFVRAGPRGGIGHRRADPSRRGRQRRSLPDPCLAPGRAAGRRASVGPGRDADDSWRAKGRGVGAERALAAARAPAGAVERTVTLPGSVDVEAARASYENGVLTLSLPKATQAQPRKIRVDGVGERPQATGTNGSVERVAAPERTARRRGARRRPRTRRRAAPGRRRSPTSMWMRWKSSPWSPSPLAIPRRGHPSAHRRIVRLAGSSCSRSIQRGPVCRGGGAGPLCRGGGG